METPIINDDSSVVEDIPNKPRRKRTSQSIQDQHEVKKVKKTLFDNNDIVEVEGIVDEDPSNSRESDEIIDFDNGGKNICLVCGVDIGDNNGRQLCNKTKCFYDTENNAENDADDCGNSNSSSDEEFISVEAFKEVVESEKPISWVDLDRTKVYKVIKVEDETIEEDNNATRIAQIGTVQTSKKEMKKVWLPSIVVNKLQGKIVPSVNVYMQPHEPCISKKTKRRYHNADVIVKPK